MRHNLFIFVASLHTARHLPPAAALLCSCCAPLGAWSASRLIYLFLPLRSTPPDIFLRRQLFFAPAACRSARGRPRDLFLSLRSTPPDIFLRRQLFFAPTACRSAHGRPRDLFIYFVASLQLRQKSSSGGSSSLLLLRAARRVVGFAT
jgi:hypothetical protein